MDLDDLFDEVGKHLQGEVRHLQLKEDYKRRFKKRLRDGDLLKGLKGGFVFNDDGLSIQFQDTDEEVALFAAHVLVITQMKICMDMWTKKHGKASCCQHAIALGFGELAMQYAKCKLGIDLQGTGDQSDVTETKKKKSKKRKRRRRNDAEMD